LNGKTVKDHTILRVFFDMLNRTFGATFFRTETSRSVLSFPHYIGMSEKHMSESLAAATGGLNAKLRDKKTGAA